MDPAQDPRFAAGAELEGERATLLEYLRAYRLALETQVRRPRRGAAGPALGAALHHVSARHGPPPGRRERNWFRRVITRADAPPLYWSDDAEDADWAGAVADPAVVADAWRAWHEEVAFAERFIAGSPDLAYPAAIGPTGGALACGS